MEVEVHQSLLLVEVAEHQNQRMEEEEVVVEHQNLEKAAVVEVAAHQNQEKVVVVEEEEAVVKMV